MPDKKKLRLGIVLSDGNKDIITLHPDGTLSADWATIRRMRDEWDAGTGQTDQHRWCAVIWAVRNN